jgi:NADH:ubiquinone oxidoreductase subunit 4 (subunit M)
MSFREKTAWLTVCAIVIVSLMFWFHAPPRFEPHTHRWAMLAFLVSLGAYVLIEVVGYGVLRLRYPADARTPRDERERLIDLKSLRVAYYTFVAGTFGGIFFMLHLAGAGPGHIGLVVLAAFVLSQVAKHAARIIYFRRG